MATNTSDAIVNAARVLMLVVALGIVVLLIADLREARANPDDYVRVHGGTIDEYAADTHRKIGIVSLGILLPSLAWFDGPRRRFWDLAMLTLYVTAAAGFVTTLIRWADSGFDH
jgi:hypothetical protein